MLRSEDTLFDTFQVLNLSNYLTENIVTSVDLDANNAKLAKQTGVAIAKIGLSLTAGIASSVLDATFALMVASFNKFWIQNRIYLITRIKPLMFRFVHAEMMKMMQKSYHVQYTDDCKNRLATSFHKYVTTSDAIFRTAREVKQLLYSTFDSRLLFKLKKLKNNTLELTAEEKTYVVKGGLVARIKNVPDGVVRVSPTTPDSMVLEASSILLVQPLVDKGGGNVELGKDVYQFLNDGRALGVPVPSEVQVRDLASS